MVLLLVVKYYKTYLEISEILLKEGIQTIIIMCSAYNGQENAE
jgi:hypothetical protein